MRRHDGSAGWSVAHESDVMSGWAVEVSGATAAREAGKVSLFGKRVGDMYGLDESDE